MTSLHQKYRPRTLDHIIGHAKTVSTLRGWIDPDARRPSAVLITGPTSSGKTTLARAWARDVLGEDLEANSNWSEFNLSDSRSIEDVRGLIREARLRPINAPHRFVLLDEAQGILGNAPAANALLKPLEEPSSTTTFILSSMDSEKFSSSALGKALANRCVKIKLDPHSPDEMRTQAKRILKGEGKPKLLTDAALSTLTNQHGLSMRELANQLETLLIQCGEKSSIPDSQLELLLEADSHSDDELATKFLLSIYSLKFAVAQPLLLDIKEPVTFINRCTWISWYLLNSFLIRGRHPKLWGSKWASKAQSELKAAWSELKTSDQLFRLATVNSSLIKLRLQSGAFSVDEAMSLSLMAYESIEKMRST